MKTCGPALCLLAGLLPLVLWGLLGALGWGPDAQVLSGTLPPGDPLLAALRGLSFLTARLAAWTLGPPLVVGGLLWGGLARADHLRTRTGRG